jgi:hypothetical protein
MRILLKKKKFYISGCLTFGVNWMAWGWWYSSELAVKSIYNSGQKVMCLCIPCGVDLKMANGHQISLGVFRAIREGIDLNTYLLEIRRKIDLVTWSLVGEVNVAFG